MTSLTFAKSFTDAVYALDAAQSDLLPKSLTEMVKLRASYINGCHYCIKLHSEYLEDNGATPEVIAALRDPILWAADGLFSPAEVAAIRFGEVLTDAPRGMEAPARAVASEHFSAKEIAALAEHILVINLWNRFTRASE